MGECISRMKREMEAQRQQYEGQRQPPPQPQEKQPQPLELPESDNLRIQRERTMQVRAEAMRTEAATEFASTAISENNAQMREMAQNQKETMNHLIDDSGGRQSTLISLGERDRLALMAIIESKTKTVEDAFEKRFQEQERYHEESERRLVIQAREAMMMTQRVADMKAEAQLKENIIVLFERHEVMRTKQNEFLEALNKLDVVATEIIDLLLVHLVESLKECHRVCTTLASTISRHDLLTHNKRSQFRDGLKNITQKINSYQYNIGMIRVEQLRECQDSGKNISKKILFYQKQFRRLTEAIYSLPNFDESRPRHSRSSSGGNNVPFSLRGS